MAPRRKTTGPQDDFIRAGVMKGWGAAQIYRDLLKHPDLIADVSITERTVQNRVREFAVEDPSGPWSLVDADPDEPALVLDVVEHMNRVSQGKIWLTKEAAGLVAQLRRGHADIPPAWAYIMATMYQQTWARDGDTRPLDLAVASAPWRRTGPPESWGLYQPRLSPRGSGGQSAPDLIALIRLLTEFAIGFSVEDPEPPDDVAE